MFFSLSKQGSACPHFLKINPQSGEGWVSSFPNVYDEFMWQVYGCVYRGSWFLKIQPLSVQIHTHILPHTYTADCLVTQHQMAARLYCENRKLYALLVLNKARGSGLWPWLTSLWLAPNIRTTPARTPLNHQRNTSESANGGGSGCAQKKQEHVQ